MKRILAILLIACGLILSGCGGSHSRGLFEAQVAGQTEEEVIKRVGKPDSVDKSNEKLVKLIYKGRTFDSNGNGLKDNEAVITLEKDKDGKYVATSVYFS
jgi:protein involved in sex pheromone biosynthesis